MFDAISRLFAAPEPTENHIDAKLAVAALLVHLAAVDGEVSAAERDAIAAALETHFNLSDAEVDHLMKEAASRDSEAVDFYQFTSSLSRLEEAERVEIVRLMWQVVFSDNVNHEMEDNMVWRVAELIGVSARQRTELRRRMKRG